MEDRTNPYNPKNKEITLQELDTLFQSFHINYKVNNLNLFKRSFVHRSYLKTDNVHFQKVSNCMELKQHSNERLEFLGDGILEAITKMYLYKRFPDADEGFMTEKKICLVKNEHIGKLAYKLGLQQWFIISRNAEEKKTRVNYKKLGCLFEAFLGALFLDANLNQVEDVKFAHVFNVGVGFQYCQLFIEYIYEHFVDWNEILETDDNFKNILQVKIQKEFKRTPHYIILTQDEDMRYHMGVFLCLTDNIHVLNPSDARPFEEVKTFDQIQVDTHPFVFLGSGTHKIKKKAEQLACLDALTKIEKYENQRKDK